MFDILFGWRKASKCKKLIKQLQCRLKLLKNKRSSIVRLLREDVAQLIKSGYEDTAFNRAEQLFKDESTMVVYELLDNFCEFINSNLSYIRKRKDCPNDINEAVSSLIFASSRCGDLPELRFIRKLFEERYGQRFAIAAAELFPGNLVNYQIKEKLSIKSVPDDVKLLLLDEIAKDYCLRPDILAIEYASELQQVQENSAHQVLDKDVYTCYSKSEGGQMEDLDSNKIQDIYVDSSLASKIKSTGINQSHLHSHQNSDVVSTSISSSIIQQSSPDVLESPVHNKAGKVRNFAQFDSSLECTVAGDHAKEMQNSSETNIAAVAHREERITAASSSESLLRFNEEKVVYLDDIEEFQSSMAKDGDCQDQRLFKFKPSVLPKTETVESYINHYESWSENSSSRSSRKSVKASGKKSRRRSLSRENSSINDIECEIYYHKPRKSSSSNHRPHHRTEHQKKTAAEESKQSYYAQKNPKQACFTKLGSKFQPCNCKHGQTKLWRHCHFNCKMNDCSLEHSCHCCIGNENEEQEVPPCKLQKGITKPVKCEKFCDHFGHCPSVKSRESEEEIEWRATLPQKPGRQSCGNDATEYDVFTYPDRWPDEQIKKNKANPSRRAASYSYSTMETTSWTGNRTVPSYLTVKSMPPERPKESHTDKNILRCSSFPFRYPEHVHPKLPDCDDVAAKFTALKKEHLQNKR